MSVRVMSWVWEHSRAEGTDRLVLLAIADSASDDGGNAWPSVATLAGKSKVSERTVQRAVKSLQLLGELSVEPNAGRRGANVYTVKMTPRQAVTPDNESPRQPDGASDSRGGVTPVTSGGDTAVTRTVLEPSKNRPSTSLSDAARPDVDRICNYLADRIEANGAKRPTVGKRWRDAARLLIDTDGKSEQQIIAAIDWCQTSEFWRSNILSMPKLREKYETLRLQAQRGPVTPGQRRNADDKVRDGLALAQRLAADARPNLPQIGA